MPHYADCKGVPGPVAMAFTDRHAHCILTVRTLVIENTENIIDGSHPVKNWC